MRSSLCARLLVGTSAVLLALMSPDSLAQPEGARQSPPTDVFDLDTRYVLSHVSVGEVVLLESQLAGNDPDWFHHHSGQVMGFPIRTPPATLSTQDVARLRDALLDSSNWSQAIKKCSISGEAAAFLRGSMGAVTVMIAQCRTAYVRSEVGVQCRVVRVEVDPIFWELIGIIRQYFPDDSTMYGY